MTDPDEFDAFYKDARGRLLLQTYALTGDVKAARSAVRDSFVVAWHHWRKVSRLPDPEGYVRPYAWTHAQRRHTARIWHRDKGLDAEVRATFDALGKLPMTQRKALLLTHLATVSMGDLAREVGLPRAEAERQLQLGTAQFAVHRDVRTTHIRPLLESLREHVEEGVWPRPSILRRAGAARRRTHTLVGAGVAVAALVLTGTVVTDASGAHPTLGREVRPAADGDLGSHRPSPTEPPPPQFSGDALLEVGQVAARVPGRGWTQGSTTDNTGGDGIVMPCQATRFADPKGRAALVRTFSTTGARPGARVVQLAELSTSDARADKTFATMLDWYAGCAEPRVQLMTTKRVDGVADAAQLLVLRAWDAPGSTYVAGVARTGRITVATLTRTPVAGAPALPQAARLLAGAVQGMCDQPDAGACVDRPKVVPTAPVPAGLVPGMLAEVDLPPIMGVTRPWVGTEPRKAVDNVAATTCDQANFNQPGISANLTRSFVIPNAKLPTQFGLTQTVGMMREPRARALVALVRKRMAACPDRELGTEVARLAQVETKERDLAVWRVTTEISDEESVTFLMGIAREGSVVGQLGFVPAGKVTMAPGAFITLMRRSAERLPAMHSSG
jgi:DNA-directed RNA polymerase specialized sigma24 family protein